MDCVNHPQTPATARCAGCAESFCAHCVLELNGQQYCRTCKMMVVKAPPVLEMDRFRCREATQALVFSCVGALGAMGEVGPCFSIVGAVFAGIGLARAQKAREAMRRDTRLSGSGAVLGAIVMGILMLVLSLAMFLANLAAKKGM